MANVLDVSPQSIEHDKLRCLPLLLTLAGIIALIWAAYGPIVGTYFRHDDFAWLEVARQWADGSRSLMQGHMGVVYIYSLYYHAMYTFAGLNPAPYLTALLICHAANTIFVMLLVWLLSGKRIQSLAAGAFFAVLYTHHEAVAWSAGGHHAFATLFLLPAVICWVLYRQGHTWGLPASVVLGVLSILTKASGGALLPIIITAEYTLYRGKSKRPVLWHLIPPFSLVLYRIAFPPLLNPVDPMSADYHPGLQTIWNLITIVPQMLVPDLRFENYMQFVERLLPANLAGYAATAALLAMVGLTALAAWGIWKAAPMGKFALLWCYAAFLPYAPFSYVYARAPRYLYISSVGLAILVAYLVGLWLSGEKRPSPGIRKFVLVGLAIVYLVGSIGFGRLVCANRLRDSALRREIIARVLFRVPQPQPGETIVVAGVPEYLRDTIKGIGLYYDVPATILRAEESPAMPPRAHYFRFEVGNTAALKEYHPPSDHWQSP